jgi:Ca2+-binding EF-hand superfamily protein/thiol-disulfide isomerase/thioredoxin
MACIVSLLPRQGSHDVKILCPTFSTGPKIIRRSSLITPTKRNLTVNTRSRATNQRLDTRICFKNNSWDAPVIDSIDDETAELLDRYATTFHEADADKDGLLQRAELRTILERVGGGNEHTPLHWLTDSDLDDIFNQYDVDDDKAINLNEFMTLAHDNVFLTKELSDYRAAFKAVDQNCDGFLGPTELLSVLSMVGSPLKSYENIVRLMDKYDTDRNGRMDFQEFLRLCRYERALPLDQILQYAGGGSGGDTFGTSGSTANSTITGSGSNGNGFTINGSTSARNGISNSSSASITATSPTSPSSTAPAAGGAAAYIAEKRAKNAQLVVAVPNEEFFNGIFEKNKDNDKLIVVMGSLTWCRPCKRFAPVYQRMAAAYPEVIFLHLNGNDNDETKQLFKHKLKIRATPSFLFFRGGVVVDSCSGANPARFESHLRKLLKGEEMPGKSLYELIDIANDVEQHGRENISVLSSSSNAATAS